MKKLYLVRTIILAGSLLLQLNTLCFHSRGAAGDVDLSFDPGSGVNGTVSSIVVQSDGKVLVGHYLGILRLNSDGSQDTNFIASLGFATDTDGNQYSAVRSIAVQSDGKPLVGGDFYTLNGTNVNFGLARLDSNGSLDSSFIQGTGVGGSVYSVVMQPDGKVLIGGGFNNVNGTNRLGIARLNANGSLDSSFNPGTGANWAISVALQTDGKVLIGGYFFTVNGTDRNRIARLNANGSLDSSFNPGTGADSPVLSIAVQSDGKTLIGGYFFTVNGTDRNGIARLNANGSLDDSFNPGIEAPGYPFLNSVVVQSDGKVLMGGAFSTVNTTNRNNLARLNSNGGLDGSFNPGTGVNNLVASLVTQPDGKVLIGGDFTTVKDISRSAIARLNGDGSGDSSFNANVYAFANGGVYPIALQPDGKMLVGAIMARLNSSGSLDTNFHPNLTAIYTGDCYPGNVCSDYANATAVAVQSDGKLLLSGVSTHFNCDASGGGCILSYTFFVTRLNADGSHDINFNSITNVGGPVASIAVQPDGKALIGGHFFSVNGTNRFGLARLNSNGSLDDGFNASAQVDSLVLQPDGKILICGYFITVDGANRNGIARLNADGSLDNTFNPGTGANRRVYSIALQSNGKVLIGGDFTTVNGMNLNHIARLNANGSLDLSFNPGTGADDVVWSIALQPDGKVLIGGDFSTVNGIVRMHVARLYGDSVAPSLNIARSNTFVIVSWPVIGLNYQLQENIDLSLPNSWSPVAQAAVTNARQISVTVPTTVGRKFFRLQSQ